MKLQHLLDTRMYISPRLCHNFLSSEPRLQSPNSNHRVLRIKMGDSNKQPSKPKSMTETTSTQTPSKSTPTTSNPAHAPLKKIPPSYTYWMCHFDQKLKGHHTLNEADDDVCPVCYHVSAESTSTGKTSADTLWTGHVSQV